MTQRFQQNWYLKDSYGECEPHGPSENSLRSTCGERCWGRTRRTPAWRSTSAGRWRARRGWSRRSEYSAGQDLHGAGRPSLRRSSYMVLPPDSTMLAYRSLRMSTSHFLTVANRVLCLPKGTRCVIPVPDLVSAQVLAMDAENKRIITC
ncbi:hypothetical protein BASA81_001964 [Batrachochytrium salamandrivorans]|nr:hypothetical protein BASA81_001964 [Batrachochytrium salamandrivorans]